MVRGRHAKDAVLKVLIAEDDVMIADLVKEVLVGSGYQVCGIARTVGEAVSLGVLHGPDLAVIDQRLADGEFGTEIAPRLADSGNRRRPGVLYTTANVSNVLLIASAGEACLKKPYSAEDLLRALQLVTEIVSTGVASPPFPRGFQRMNSPLLARASADHG